VCNGTGAIFVYITKFFSLYLLMFALVLRLISYVPIILTLLLKKKTFYYTSTIIYVYSVYAYKSYSISVSPGSFKFVAFVVVGKFISLM